MDDNFHYTPNKCTEKKRKKKRGKTLSLVFFFNRRMQPFFGQIGRVTFLSEIITREEFKTVYRLGPNMVTAKRHSEYVFFLF